MQGHGLILAALLLIPAGASAASKKDVLRLMAYVMEIGKDDVLRPNVAQPIGFEDEEPVPVRVVTLEGKDSPDGKKRSISVAYNSNGSKARPAGLVLWRTDFVAARRSGERREGAVFLARSDGTLAHATQVHQDRGEESPYGFDTYFLSDAEKDFKRELRLWLGWRRDR
jgi:hypothetical protein